MKLGLSNSINNRIDAVWTPAKLSSLIHWYRFDTGITYDGEGDITEWTDQKGSNDLTSTGVSANSPTYDSGAVFFNAGGDILTFNAPLDLGIFAIYVRLEAAEFDGDFIFEETPNEFIKLHDTNNIRIKIAGGSRHDISSGVELELDTKFNIGFEREDTAATTDDQMFVFVDNVNKAFDGGNGTQDISELLEITTIGKPSDQCKFYEIIICEDALNNTDRASLNTYLNTI